MGRSEAKPVAPALQASLATNPRRKSPFGLLTVGGSTAVLRNYSDVCRLPI